MVAIDVVGRVGLGVSPRNLTERYERSALLRLRKTEPVVRHLPVPKQGRIGPPYELKLRTT